MWWHARDCLGMITLGIDRDISPDPDSAEHWTRYMGFVQWFVKPLEPLHFLIQILKLYQHIGKQNFEIMYYSQYLPSALLNTYVWTLQIQTYSKQAVHESSCPCNQILIASRLSQSLIKSSNGSFLFSLHDNNVNVRLALAACSVGLHMRVLLLHNGLLCQHLSMVSI